MASSKGLAGKNDPRVKVTHLINC